LFFNFASECAISRVQVKHDGLELRGTYLLLVYADDVNILGGRVHTIEKNAEAWIMASKETVLEVSADKTKYMFLCRDQNAGRNMQTGNNAFERIEHFIYLVTTLKNQNSIQEETKSRLKAGNACYHSVQNLLCSILLSKNVKIQLYRTNILPDFCMGVKLGHSHRGRNVG